MRDSIQKQAKALVGVPWLHRGRSLQGLDCAGVVYLVGTLLGLLPQEFEHLPRYPVDVDSDILFKALVTLLKRNPHAQRPLPGDVLLFRTGKHPGHCGILVEGTSGLSVVHASRFGVQCVVEQKMTLDLWDRVVASFSFGEPHGQRGKEP